MKPLRVLFLIPTFAGGGAERCARELFTRLPALDVTTEMWTARRAPTDPEGVRSVRLPLERYGIAFDFVTYYNDWRHVGSRIRLAGVTRDRFDVVHMHNIHSNWLSIRAVHDLCRRVPVVWTLHDEWAPSAGLAIDLARVLPPSEARRLSSRFLPYYPSRGVKRMRRHLSRFMPQPRAIICPSAWLAGRTVESGRFPGVPVHHIPNGLTLLESPAIEMPKQLARARFGLANDRPVVLLIANRLDAHHKGADLAVEVLRGMSERPQVLVLGRQADALRAALAPLRVVTGWADDAETLAASYRAADVTLVPSRADNLPFVVLESFACRTPVAAFAVGGLPELLQDDRGLLAPAFDVTALREQAGRLIGDAALASRLTDHGYRWVRENCDMRRFLARIVALYRDVSSD